MNKDTLRKLFLEIIRDIYDAEKQLVKALPKMAKAAESEDLSEAFRSHLEETQNHVARLEEVFSVIGAAAKGKPCKGMKGLIEEGNEAIQEDEKGTLRDLAMIAGAQKVEHYEISAYGTARTLAEQLGITEAAELLEQTEGEEKNADGKLTQIAVSIYESAGEDEDEEVEDEEETATVGAARSGGRAPAKK